MSASTTTPCAHRWRIEPPNGPTVAGVCQKCGAEKTYATAPEYPMWSDHSEQSRAERYARRVL